MVFMPFLLKYEYQNPMLAQDVYRSLWTHKHKTCIQLLVTWQWNTAPYEDIWVASGSKANVLQQTAVSAVAHNMLSLI
jgi:hypothetical protein